MVYRFRKLIWVGLATVVAIVFLYAPANPQKETAEYRSDPTSNPINNSVEKSPHRKAKAEIIKTKTYRADSDKQTDGLEATTDWTQSTLAWPHMKLVETEAPTGGEKRYNTKKKERKKAKMNKKVQDKKAKMDHKNKSKADQKISVQKVAKVKKIKKMKRILLWNDFYGSRNYGMCCGNNPFNKAGCPVSSCQTTKFRDENLEDIDAVVFHQRTLVEEDIPAVRLPEQVYVFLSLESPVYDSIQYSHWNSFFNISMTYRTDSDVYMPYGTVREKPVADSQIFGLEMVESKTGFAAWFVSHCSTSSKREVVVENLAKHLPDNSIDIYGACGPLACIKKAECWEMVSHKYKFYLSLENSICKDYVTEKLFDALKLNVVPVVLGGGNYSTLLPQNSYIDIAQFSSLKDLGDYLMYLDSHPTEYLKYFSWKKTHEILNSKQAFNQAFCRLCQYLHEDHSSPVLEDLEDWWVRKSHCS